MKHECFSFFSVIWRIGDSGILRDQMFAMKKYCTLHIYLCVLLIATHLFLRVKKKRGNWILRSNFKTT